MKYIFHLTETEKCFYLIKKFERVNNDILFVTA